MSTRFIIRRVVGTDRVLAGMLAEGGKLASGAAKALTDEANAILRQAMTQTPVKTGTLRRSGTVDGPKITSSSIKIEIGFNTSYAYWVHENLKARHATGKAKFLEDPINAAVPGLAARIAARVRL